MRSNGKIIYLSSANVFDGSLDQPHYETDARISVSDYGQFKIQCEDLLHNYMDSQAVLLRLPFVWGIASKRLKAVKKGCNTGQLDIYTDFFSSHVSDMQTAQIIQWIIKEEKEGIFHVGTGDVISYQYFIEQLIAAMNWKRPSFVFQKNPGVMAVLSSRSDIPDRFHWKSRDIIEYLCIHFVQ